METVALTEAADFVNDPVAKRLPGRTETQIADMEMPRGTIVFTDDFASVEEMTRRMPNGIRHAFAVWTGPAAPSERKKFTSL